MSWQIAIDGPAGAGKSTIAKELAHRLGFEYIDTGAMYRAVTLKALNLKINMYMEEDYKFLDETKIDFINQHLFLDNKDVSDEIRSLEVSNNVSLVSKFGYVRERLVHLQRELADSKNIIMDGRDIGTVVLPNADLKIYLNATVEERARRRMNERLEKNQEVQDLETTIKEIEERDFKDSNRPISPLVKAKDAIEIDSSKLNVENVIDEIIKLVLKRGYKMENLETNKPQVKETTETATVENVQNVQNVQIQEEQTNAEVEVSNDDTQVNENEDNNEVEKATPKYRELQVVEGTVIEVIEAKPEVVKGKKTFKAKEERVLIRLEDGQEGYLFRKDTANIKEDEDLFDLFVENDKVQVVIKKIYPDGGKFVFSTVLLQMRNDLKNYNEIIKEHGTFTAKVVKALSVGYLLKHGDFSCLLPTSQVAVPEEERADLVGKEIEVAPIRIDYGRIRVIVSQSVANAIKKRNDRKVFLDQIQVGQVFDGVVKNIESYGAFVEIGNGIEGLLHISELDHQRVFKVEKILNPGDQVKVKVIKIDNEHIGLSRKALIPNFWQEYTQDKEVGSIVNGKVIEINNSGLVLELAQEVTGFLPKSEFAYEKDVFVTDTVNVNDNIDVKVIEIDAHKKRIILSKKQLTANPWENLNFKINDSIEVVVTKELKEGYKVDYKGASGYLPKSNISNYNDPIEIGNTLKVKVRVFDPEKTRLVVNLRIETEQHHYERESNKEYNKFMKPSQEKLSNTFGDLLEEQLKGLKK